MTTEINIHNIISESETFYTEFKVAGVSYRPLEAKAFIGYAGDHNDRNYIGIELVPEPQNPYDPNAIRVEGVATGIDLDKRFHIGYVPRDLAAQIATEKPNLKAYLTQITLNKAGFPSFQVALYTTPPAEDTVTISRKEYDSLLSAEQELSALNAAGVDNWEGYDEAMKILNEMQAEDE